MAEQVASPGAPDFWSRVPAERYRPVVAEAIYDDMRVTMFALGDPDRAGTPAVVIFHMPPSGVLARHSHDCERLEIVLQGSLETENGVLHAGDVMVAHPNQMYGPHTAGPEGYTVAEVFSTIAGTHQITWDTPRGPRFQDAIEHFRARDARQSDGEDR
jgi:hypothetical protein